MSHHEGQDGDNGMQGVNSDEYDEIDYKICGELGRIIKS